MLNEDAFREAEEIDVINAVLEWDHHRSQRPELTNEVMRSVGSH